MDSGLKDTRAQYLAGALTKPEYVERMRRLHALLFEYAEFIRSTEIGKIEIGDGRLIMTTRLGVRFLCDPRDPRLPPLQALDFGRYEGAAADMLFRLVEPGSAVYDVGANVGWYSLQIAASVPGTRVFAFEPIPETFAKLRGNIELNNLGNVLALPWGLSDREGDVPFCYYPEDPTASSAVNILESDTGREITCRVRRLDDVQEEIGAPPDFIKCDVEGGELFVFQGARRCLAQNRPAVYCEMLRKWSAKFGYHPNRLIALLESFGYGCYEVSGDRLRRLVRMDDRTEATNFFFLHGERHRQALDRLVVEEQGSS